MVAGVFQQVEETCWIFTLSTLTNSSEPGRDQLSRFRDVVPEECLKESITERTIPSMAVQRTLQVKAVFQGPINLS